MNNTKERRMQWHPACFAALNLEFTENKKDLEFMQELSINDLPLRADILIIKNESHCRIKNEIGKLFRAYNLVEYKSPEAELSFNCFLVPIQIVVASKLDKKYHIWLNSLTKKLSMEQAKGLVSTTNELANVSEKRFADTVWEIVTRANKELIEKMKEENIMCKAMAEISDVLVERALMEC